MKKIILIALVMLILTCVLTENKQFSLLDYFEGDYTVYSSQSVGENSVNLGFCYMNTERVDNHVVGESIKIKNLEISAAIKTLNASVVKTECLEDGSPVIYAYTNLIKENVKVGNKKVNLQIVEKQDYCIIGWPLILGSY